MGLEYDFASLLDDKVGLSAFDRSPTRLAFSFDPLLIADSLEVSAVPVSNHIAAAEYASVREAWEEFEAEAELADILEPPSIDPAEIAAELEIARLDAAGLSLLRRQFARENHPDRVPEAIRDAALVRMQIANAMIDEAEQRLARPTC